jgi:ubiquinone/menaquinone biosynthesis C-methylase UbiE
MFKDYFSKQSKDYSIYRPRYPESMFEYLANLVSEKKIAWDCGTGNGQSALGLTPYFEKIIATDASESQIKNAIQHHKITYYVSPAEKTNIESNSINLVTVAQALHWFDINHFYQEVKRVIRPQGIIAVWVYDLLEISPEIDSIVKDFNINIVGPYWPPERKLVDEKYQTIPFPFDELKTPQFYIYQEWNLENLLGYFNTWSSTQRFIEANGYNPVNKIVQRLSDLWKPGDSKKKIRWPLYVRVGVVK